MIISQQGMILRMRAGDVRAIGRATQGVRLIEMEEGDEVVADREAGREGSGERRRAGGRAGRPPAGGRSRPRRNASRGVRLDRRTVVASGLAGLYAGSSFAYFASSFFTPTMLKRTVIFRSSLCSSTDTRCRRRTARGARACRSAALPGLIFVLVLVGLRPTRARGRAPCPSARTGSSGTRSARDANVLWYAEAYVGVDPLDELRRNLVEEPRRIGGLVFAEHPPPRRAGEDQLGLARASSRRSRGGAPPRAPPRPRSSGSGGTGPPRGRQ